MDHWTVNQVADWLKNNALEQFVQTFIEEDIDGMALMGLSEEEILKLLSTVDDNGRRKAPNLRTQRHFRKLFEQSRSQIKQKTKKKQGISSTDNEEISSKIYTIQSTTDSLIFLRNEWITIYLRKYFREKYKVNCDMSNSVDVNLSGTRENMTNVQNDLQAIFTSVETKIFNDEVIHKRILRWSKSIYSQSILMILQRIFANKKMLTIWEKSNLLSGYLQVHYLIGQHSFSASESSITPVLDQEIAFVRDMIVSNLETISKKYREELEELIRGMKEQQQREQIMAILVYQYPSQTEMKISLFGLKNQVYLAKKQIKMLVNKHQIRTIRIGLDSTQRIHLLDHHISQLHEIELNYSNDHVKINIHEDVIHAPQYLIIKIKEFVQSMTNQRRILRFSCIPNGMRVTDHDRLQVQILAQHHNCQIEQIQTTMTKELIVLPKGKNSITSKYLNKESNQFQSAFPMSKSLAVSQHTIEIHQSYDQSIDLTVISTLSDINREQINPELGNGYYESENQKKVLFMQWSPSHLKPSIKTFISTSFNQIDTLCGDTIRTIAFSTTDWEKWDQRKELIEGILREIQSQLRSKRLFHRSWRILFILPEEQKDFFTEFSQAISNEDANQQFLHPISTISITLTASGNTNLSKCEHAIRNYINQNVLTTMKIPNPFDLNIWNQSAINAFYKHCLEKLVLPRVHHHLELIGSISAVNEVQQKYQLMSDIERQRPLRKPPTIALNCSSEDRILSNQLAQRLTDEGYSVSTFYSNLRSKFDKADLILICFSWNYSEDVHCMKTIQSSKNFIPILFTRSSINEQDSWLRSITVEERFYFSFKQDIRFRLNEDFNLDYDRLIFELIRTSNERMDIPLVKNLEQQKVLPRFTPEEIDEKKRIYEQQIHQRLERDRIPPDELADLITSLNDVLEAGSYSLESTIERWLEKAETGLVIKGNLPPLTFTGDYNDAIFPTFWTEKDPWWIGWKDFDHSFSDFLEEFDDWRIGSWSNYDDTDRFFHQFLDREIAFRQRKEKERSSSSTFYESRYPHFKTTIRKGKTAWGITEDREVLGEYQRQINGGKPLKSTRLSSGWVRWLNRSVKFISEIKGGSLHLQSDGTPRKKRKRKREQLSRPPEITLRNEECSQRLKEFLQNQNDHMIQWKDLCSRQ